MKGRKTMKSFFKSLILLILAVSSLSLICGCGDKEEIDTTIYYEEPFKDDGIQYRIISFAIYENEILNEKSLAFGIEAIALVDSGYSTFDARTTLYNPEGLALSDSLLTFDPNAPREFDFSQMKKGASVQFWSPFYYGGADGEYELVYDCWDNDYELSFKFTLADSGRTVILPTKEGTVTYQKNDDNQWVLVE